MNGNDNELHSRILDWLRFPTGQEKFHLYQIGSTASTLNVHAQQKRAFNLLWSLDSEGFKFNEHEVAIVGGGIAGLTTAAGFAVLGAKKITIYERTSHLIHLQQGNTTRCLHPNFAIWPHETFRYPLTHLPFMNWRSGAAGEVADQLLWQWKTLEDLYKDRIHINFGCSVRSLDFAEGQPLISIKTDKAGKGGKYPIVVLAVGYGIEAHTLAETPSYWRNDELSQPIIGSCSKVSFLVSGTGDGGLIECLRLTIDKFQHQTFLQKIMYDDDLLSLGRELQQLLSKSTSTIAVWQSFLKEPLSDQQELILRKFRSFYRDDTAVILNARKAYPSQTDALLLHRLCVALLIKDRKIRYEKGDLEPEVLFDKKRHLFISKIKTSCFTHRKIESQKVIRRQSAVPDINKLFVLKYNRGYFRKLREDWITQERTPEGDITIQSEHLGRLFADEFMKCHFEREYEVAYRCPQGNAGEIANLLVNRLPSSLQSQVTETVRLPLELRDGDRFVKLELKDRFIINFRGFQLERECWSVRSPIIANERFLVVRTNSRAILEQVAADSDDLKYCVLTYYLTEIPTKYFPAGLALDPEVIECGSRVFIVNRLNESCLEIHCDEGMSQAHFLLRAPTIFEILLNKWPTTKVHGIAWAVRNTRHTNQTHQRGSEILQWDPPGYSLRLERKDDV